MNRTNKNESISKIHTYFNMLDFSIISQAALSQAVHLISSWVPGGRFQGDEYVVRNPKREDSKPGSFLINYKKGTWSDFAISGAKGGDLISLFAYLHDLSQGQAASELSKLFSIEQPKSLPGPSQPERPEILLDPVPDNPPPLPEDIHVKVDEKWVKCPISYMWPYKTADGKVRFWIARGEFNGKKEVRPITLWKNPDTGRLRWKSKRILDKMPIFNLDKITQHPKAQVIVVEGEKSAGALQRMIEENRAQENLVATTWHGGVENIKKTDWSGLSGRRCLTWPDFDKQKNGDELKPIEEQPGFLAMAAINKILHKQKCDILTIRPDFDHSEGWDVADAIMIDRWSFKDILEFLKKRKIRPEFDRQPEKAPEPTPLPPDQPALSPQNAPAEEFPFRCLGYDREFYYYLPNGTRLVRAIKPESHGAKMLTALAPLSFWERNYPSKQGPQWALAANNLMRSCERNGYYSPDYLRGRGAWYDAGRVVLHLGDHLLVDGAEVQVENVQSKYIYEVGKSLETKKSSPLSLAEANKLQKISDSLFWERPVYSKLFTGWMVCAIICGALRYRPHIWLTGKSKAGKSWIMDNILRPVLGEFALSMASSTSEAGVRQRLHGDALSIIIDEFEGNDIPAQIRVQNILELARLAFSNDSSEIVKGTQSHRAISYQIHSCFFMSSVGVNLSQYADETRISILTIVPPYNREGETKEEHLKRLSGYISDTIRPDWCSAFRFRAINMIPMINKNVEIFTNIVARIIGNRRAGDQIAPLLAGAYSLSSNSIISEEKAQQWVDCQDWSEQHQVAEKSDEKTCVQTIVESMIKHAFNGKDVSVAELLHDSKNWDEQRSYEGSDEARTLARFGIKYDRREDVIWISESHSGLRKLLRGTPWEKSWGRHLLRIPGAQHTKGKRFYSLPSSAVGLPWKEVMGEAPREPGAEDW